MILERSGIIGTFVERSAALSTCWVGLPRLF